MRKLYAVDIEACRQIQDRQLVEAGIKQVAADPANAAAHLDALLGNAETNWPKDELAAMVADFAANADRIAFQSGTGPYVGDFMEEHDGLWMVPRDEGTWRKVIEAVSYTHLFSPRSLITDILKKAVLIENCIGMCSSSAE